MTSSLRDIYNDLISISCQIGDTHKKFMSLNFALKGGGGYQTTATDEWLPNWAADEADRIGSDVVALADKMWNLPEVNGHEERELDLKKAEQRVNVLKGEAWKNNE